MIRCQRTSKGSTTPCHVTVINFSEPLCPRTDVIWTSPSRQLKKLAGQTADCSSDWGPTEDGRRVGGGDCSSDRQSLRTGVLLLLLLLLLLLRRPALIIRKPSRHPGYDFRSHRSVVVVAERFHLLPARRWRQPVDGRRARPVSRRCDVQHRLTDYWSNFEIRRLPAPLDALVDKTLSLPDFFSSSRGLLPDRWTPNLVSTRVVFPSVSFSLRRRSGRPFLLVGI